jgi:hypothetical protein
MHADEEGFAVYGISILLSSRSVYVLIWKG